MMFKEKLNMRKTVDLRLTPDDWDLYTDMPEVERVAEALNMTFNKFVNANSPRCTTVMEMNKEMNLYRNWGANDSEPHYVLEKLLEQVYE